MLKVQQIEPSKLKPWEDNPRINDEAVDAVAESIKSFGFNVPILCDQELTIIAGHTRWKAANKIGMNSVPVIILELSEAQREAFAIADNKTGEIADWDYSRLREILEKLKRKKTICRLLDIHKANYTRCLHRKKSLIGKLLRNDSNRKLLLCMYFSQLKCPWR